MKKILTIAGSDTIGGAGIQADIKTITAHKMYAMSVITSLTAQNTVGVQSIFDMPSDFTAKQIDSVFTDIRPDAVKIGMLSTAENIRVVAEKLKFYGAENIVIDPVMVSTSGHSLISEEAKKILINELFPVAGLITPNIPETEELSGMKINNIYDTVKAGRIIFEKCRVNVLVKGGHSENKADDILICEGEPVIITGNAIDIKNNIHGTGCTLSSAIACNMACRYSLNYSLKECIENAKLYIEGAIGNSMNMGKGSGILNHCWNI